MRRPMLMAITIVLLLFAVALMAGFRPTAGLAATSRVGGKPIEQVGFPGGKAVLVQSGSASYHVVMACRRLGLWRSCGAQELTVTDDPDKHAFFFSREPGERIAVFAGVLFDPTVKQVVANGEARSTEETNHYLFAWRADEFALHAQALGYDGRVLYDLGPSTGDRWHPVGAAPIEH